VAQGAALLEQDFPPRGIAGTLRRVRSPAGRAEHDDEKAGLGERGQWVFHLGKG
jgi:hypothetical protein